MPYLGNPPAERFTSFDYQDLTGGSGTSFTLDNPVGNPQEIEVFVNNVRQEPGVAYTVSGTALTMTGSVAASDDFYVVFQGKAIQTATHPSDRALTATDGTFTGDASVTGDLTVDTDTLVVDAANNRVGIGEASPAVDLEIRGSGASGQLYLGGSTDAVYSQIFSNNDGVFIIDADKGNAGADPSFRVKVEGTERLRVLSGGGLTFNGDTAAANALDDYEEGTCTITATAATTAPTSPVSTTAFYTKIGNSVTVWCDINNITMAGAAGNTRLTGLPFGASGNGSNKPGVLYVNNLVYQNTNERTPLVETSGAGNTHLNFRITRADNNAATLISATSGHIQNGTTDLRFCITYKVN